MATKKEKRERALAKRERLMQELKDMGLRAQQEDHDGRDRQMQIAQAEIAEINRRHSAILAAALMRGNN